MCEIGSGGFAVLYSCSKYSWLVRTSSSPSHLLLLSFSTQLFQSSRSPGRDARLKGAKNVKPGSFDRPTQAAGPVIGGHRYWQGQTLQPDSSQLRTQTRSGRSPRRHSPGYRKMDHTSPQPPGNPPGLLGVSFSKLNNLKHLRGRGGAPKKVLQSSKAAR